MKKLLFLLALLPLMIACSNDDDTPLNNVNVTFKFTHNWDGTALTNQDFGQFDFVNENGDVISFDRVRYLVSNIKLYSQSTGIITLQGYQLVDLSNQGSLSFSLNENLPEGEYSAISFTFGFDEEFNNSGAYADLNSVSWNWPEMLGGGYHFLQMDGNYETVEGPHPFNFHMGTARVSEGIFEANYRQVFLTQSFSLNANNTIEFKMNVAEWFKNPNTWDLNELNTDLMMNYEAQKMMYENSGSVFSLGDITTP
jgi:hypothetical protein